MNDALLPSIITGVFLIGVTLVNRLISARDARSLAEEQLRQNDRANEAALRKECRDELAVVRAERRQLELDNDVKEQRVATLTADVTAQTNLVAFWKQRTTAIELERDALRKRRL